MSIKLKLILNVLVIAIIIAGISASSYLGMKFLREKLQYLTEKTTPYQLKTIEFQKSIQVLTSDLLSLSAAQTTESLNKAKDEAEKSASVIKKAQEELEAISGDKLKVSDEMQVIFNSLYDVSKRKLAADEEAHKSGEISIQKLKEASARLMDLDKKIKSLQMTKNSRFFSVKNESERATSKVISYESAKSKIKDLKGAILLSQKQGSKADPRAAAKALATDNTLRTNSKIRGEIRALQPKIDEYSKAANEAAAVPIMEKLDSLSALIDAESAKAKDDAANASTSLETASTQTTISTNAVMNISEVMTIGLSIKELVTRLFAAHTATDIDSILEEINGQYARLNKLNANALVTIEKLQSKDELAAFKGVIGILGGIKTLVFADDGIAAKLKNRIILQEKAVAEIGKLRTIVVEQTDSAKKTVNTAQGEQEKSINAVNTMINRSILLIASTGFGAILTGILFGYWIYRSVNSPLKNLIATTRQIASGNLVTRSDTARSDEIGVVQTAMAEMTSNLRGIAAEIGHATRNLADSANQLSSTASVIDSGSGEQVSRVEQSAGAIAQMSESIDLVAHHASNTSAAASEMKSTALNGKEKMHNAVGVLESFAGTVKSSAEKVAALGDKSRQIDSIVEMINTISEQTNLLALNAAIEAARAGEHGLGFAVVADEVRALASKSGEATKDIARTINEIQNSVDESVLLIREESGAIDNIVNTVKASMEDLDHIVASMESVLEMIRQIVAATDEQHSASGKLANNIEGVSQVASHMKDAFREILLSAKGLSETADKLKDTASWFRVS